MSTIRQELTISLPREFIELCNYDMICPAVVLRDFIADLCQLINWASHPRADQYSSNGSDERDMARQYYDRVGYPYNAKWVRENIDQTKSPCFEADKHRRCCCQPQSDRCKATTI